MLGVEIAHVESTPLLSVAGVASESPSHEVRTQLVKRPQRRVGGSVREDKKNLVTRAEAVEDRARHGRNIPAIVILKNV